MAARKKAREKLARNNITADYLHKILTYNTRTGQLRWKYRDDVPHWINKRDAGRIAGSVINTGSVTVGILGQAYQAHCLIWLMMTNTYPENDIDHRDGDRANNRWKNLRPATHEQNCKNQKRKINNTSGYKGVHKNKNRWVCRITINYDRRYLGSFKTAKEAYDAYCAAAKKLHGIFARLH